jgi:hypothetical protein
MKETITLSTREVQRMQVLEQGPESQAAEIPQLEAFDRKASYKPPQRISREKLDALGTLRYVAGGALAPSKMSHDFLMQVRMDSIGTVVYSDFIRHPEWGKLL